MSGGAVTLVKLNFELILIFDFWTYFGVLDRFKKLVQNLKGIIPNEQYNNND